MSNIQEPLIEYDPDTQRVKDFITNKLLPHRGWEAAQIFIYLIPFLLSELYEIFTVSQTTITGCSLSHDTPYSLTNCFVGNVSDSIVNPYEDCFSGSLHIDLASQGFESNRWFFQVETLLLAVLVGVIVIGMEVILISLLNIQKRVLHLLSHQLYVAIQKKIYVRTIFTLALFSILYPVAKYLIHQAIEETAYFQCNTPSLQYRVFVQYDISYSKLSIIKTIGLMVLTMGKQIWTLIAKMRNIYEIVDFKAIVKGGSPFVWQHLTGLRKVRMEDLQKQLDIYVESNFPHLSQKEKKKKKDFSNASFNLIHELIHELESQGKITQIQAEP